MAKIDNPLFKLERRMGEWASCPRGEDRCQQGKSLSLLVRECSDGRRGTESGEMRAVDAMWDLATVCSVLGMGENVSLAEERSDRIREMVATTAHARRNGWITPILCLSTGRKTKKVLRDAIEAREKIVGDFWERCRPPRVS